MRSPLYVRVEISHNNPGIGSIMTLRDGTLRHTGGKLTQLARSHSKWKSGFSSPYTLCLSSLGVPISDPAASALIIHFPVVPHAPLPLSILSKLAFCTHSLVPHFPRKILILLFFSIVHIPGDSHIHTTGSDLPSELPAT